MKHIIVTFFLIACGSPKSAPSNPDIAPASNADIAVESPPSSSTPCSQEIALECPGGVDGCTTGKTAVHVCVSTTAQAGPSCSQEIALECPAGEVDACLVTPVAAPHHICVRR